MALYEKAINAMPSLFQETYPALHNKDVKFKQSISTISLNLGLTFQIADDTLDYNSDLKLFGKKIGQDFFEGKITLPIILLFQKLVLNEKKLLIEIFQKDHNSQQRVSQLHRAIGPPLKTR